MYSLTYALFHYTVVTPYSRELCSKTSSVCLKLQRVANSVYTILYILFSYILMPLIKFNFYTRPGQSLATIINNIIEQLQPYAVIKVM